MILNYIMVKIKWVINKNKKFEDENLVIFSNKCVNS